MNAAVLSEDKRSEEKSREEKSPGQEGCEKSREEKSPGQKGSEKGREEKSSEEKSREEKEITLLNPRRALSAPMCWCKAVM